MVYNHPLFENMGYVCVYFIPTRVGIGPYANLGVLHAEAIKAVRLVVSTAFW